MYPAFSSFSCTFSVVTLLFPSLAATRVHRKHSPRNRSPLSGLGLNVNTPLDLYFRCLNNNKLETLLKSRAKLLLKKSEAISTFLPFCCIFFNAVSSISFFIPIVICSSHMEQYWNRWISWNPLCTCCFLFRPCLSSKNYSHEERRKSVINVFVFIQGGKKARERMRLKQRNSEKNRAIKMLAISKINKFICH